MPSDKSIRIAGIVRESIVDGPGLRYVVFVQGCPHHCEGCHNPETWSKCGGKTTTVSNIIEDIEATEGITGVTISGGEPFDQADACADIAKWCDEHGLNVWVYTGYTIEEIREIGEYDKIRLLANADCLVDGKFDINKKTYDIPFVGSSNQRVIKFEQ